MSGRSYWSGLRPVGTQARIWMLEPDCAYTFPNEDGLTLALVAPHQDRLPEFRADREGAYMRMLRSLPDAPEFDAASRESKLLGKLDVPNTIRPAARPGVAFVGDAALAADPFWGVGCGWAFQSSEWLVAETAPALLGGGDVDAALDRATVDFMAMPNVYEPDFEDREAPPGFRSRRARIGYALGSELIGASLWELPPGEAAYPYHFHFSDEELLVVLSGRPTLRTPEGVRELAEGEVVRFALGEEGAHQILNPTDVPIRFLAVSSSGRPDIVVYPDSDKISASERLPGGGGLFAFFRQGDAVDYWEGERPPS